MNSYELTIGVTGHRFLADISRLEAAVEAVLDRIEAEFPTATLTLLSPLAEGADQLVAKRVIERSHYRLVVPLPFARTEYAQDFAARAARTAFHTLYEQADDVIELPPQSNRNAAYAAVGDYVAQRSDILVAIWDGAPAQGRGGTADVVARFRATDKPLAWIKAGNRIPNTSEPTILGAEQGQVLFEKFPT